MYYLIDSLGNTVRAIQWVKNDLIIIQRLDNHRIETTSDLQFYDLQKIKYIILDYVSLDYFNTQKTFRIKNINRHLTLVLKSDNILKNIELCEDESNQFKSFLQKTTLTAAILISVIVFATLLTNKKKPTQELNIVQVMNREQILKSIIKTAQFKKSKPLEKINVTKKKNSHMHLTQKNTMSTRSHGLLTALGRLIQSSHREGLNLDQVTTTGISYKGINSNGRRQNTKYARGLFSAPLSTDEKVNGLGGYGTKGKGGGKVGYGQIQLVGQGGQNFFQPIESEAFVGGGLDRNEISAVIQRHLSEVRYCYEQGLQSKPHLSGRVSIKFLIGSQGAVSLATVDQSSLGHTAVESCIRDRLKTWSFPHPEGGVTVKVTYPFILRRVSDS